VSLAAQRSARWLIFQIETRSRKEEDCWLPTFLEMCCPNATPSLFLEKMSILPALFLFISTPKVIRYLAGHAPSTNGAALGVRLLD
jgi:hypothetical protein